MGQIAINFALSHQQWVEGMALGFLLSHPGSCAIVLFNLFVKIPYVGPWIAAHPDDAKAWADGFDKSIDDCVNKYAASQAPVVPPKP
jgi:hypothetical protein